MALADRHAAGDKVGGGPNTLGLMAAEGGNHPVVIGAVDVPRASFPAIVVFRRLLDQMIGVETAAVVTNVRDLHARASTATHGGHKRDLMQQVLSL